MRNLKRFECMIDFDQRELLVKATIQPVVHAPHVGADSPRFLKPGKPAEVIYYELFDDEGEDVTIEYYMERDHEAIKRLILEEWKFSCVADRLMEQMA